MAQNTEGQTTETKTTAGASPGAPAASEPDTKVAPEGQDGAQTVTLTLEELQSKIDKAVGKARTQWERKSSAQLRETLRKEILEELEERSPSPSEKSTQENNQENNHKLQEERLALKTKIKEQEELLASIEQEYTDMLEEEIQGLPPELLDFLDDEGLSTRQKFTLVRKLKKALPKYETFGVRTAREGNPPQGPKPGELGLARFQKRQELLKRQATEGLNPFTRLSTSTKE